MQDALAFGLATAAAGCLMLLGASPLFPRLRPLAGGRRNPNLALWAGLALVMAVGSAWLVPHP